MSTVTVRSGAPTKETKVVSTTDRRARAADLAAVAVAVAAQRSQRERERTRPCTHHALYMRTPPSLPFPLLASRFFSNSALEYEGVPGKCFLGGKIQNPTPPTACLSLARPRALPPCVLVESDF